MEPHLHEDDAILSAFSAGLNTADIARMLGLPECYVANRFQRLRDERRAKARDVLSDIETKVGVVPIARMGVPAPARHTPADLARVTAANLRRGSLRVVGSPPKLKPNKPGRLVAMQTGRL